MNFHREISTDEYLGTFKQSTEQGEKRERVLSLVDKLYRPDKDGKRAIDVNQWTAAGTPRNLIMLEMPPSEGVSSYGQSVKASQANTKADRRGKLYTGYQIGPTGGVSYPGGRKSRSNEWTLLEALEAAVGKGNRKHAEMLIRVVIETEAMPTLTQLTLEMTDYYGAKSKQTPPFALGCISVWLYRLHLHFKETGRA
jgi:hypothetical protein